MVSRYEATIYIDDTVEVTMIAWRKAEGGYEVYNVASED
jgi:hypothetical protein